MISSASKRSVLRWIHLIFTIPILGYVYSPFEELPNYAPVVIHRAEDLVGDSCATIEKIGPIGVNSSHNTAIKGDLRERRRNLEDVVTGTT